MRAMADEESPTMTDSADTGDMTDGWRADPLPEPGLTRRLVRAIEAALPAPFKRLLKRSVQQPKVGRVDMGDLRRTRPISKWWGWARGTPVDRHYIEGFLSENRADVRGRAMEVGDVRYITEFGGDRVTSTDVLNYVDLPSTTIVADLVDAPDIPDDSFDCIICTQVLQFTKDPAAALATMRRILAPGGTLLMTVPCVSNLDTEANWHDRWRFTSRAVTEMAESAAKAGDDIRIESHGNVLAIVTFLHGLSAEELAPEELAERDGRYEMIVTLRLRKAG
jgi:hypothetical protein